jgi:hypothetical protein
VGAEAGIEVIFDIEKMYDVEPVRCEPPEADWIETRVAAAL